MNGRRLMIGFLAFVVVFAIGLIYAQFFAYYTRERDVATLEIAGAAVPVSDYDGIDATSSPLKLRGCFRLDPAAVADATPAAEPTPLTAPFWFRCFDAGQLTEDLAAGRAQAFMVATDSPRGFDELVAVYPDGRGYLWRQLNARFAE